MWFTGTLVNFVAVLAGGLIGTFLGDRLPDRLRENVVAGVGLFVLVMGMRFALDTSNLLYLLGAILIGGALGSAAGLERRLNAVGAALQARFAAPGSRSTIAEGFVTAAIVFCVGPLTFLGAIRNGSRAMGRCCTSRACSTASPRSPSQQRSGGACCSRSW